MLLRRRLELNFSWCIKKPKWWVENMFPKSGRRCLWKKEILTHTAAAQICLESTDELCDTHFTHSFQSHSYASKHSSIRKKTSAFIFLQGVDYRGDFILLLKKLRRISVEKRTEEPGCQFSLMPRTERTSRQRDIAPSVCV